ncbi:MAG TPA: CARDB domain-containing protein [Dissulfurispiraceae bacterium]|nr:CARDB domain-containing protein [Dissulfurispiraceae bacterium]
MIYYCNTHPKMRRLIPITGLIAITLSAFAALLACASQAPLAPASFQVTSLQVSPSEVMAGDTVTVTATVTNQGNLPGNFDEPLMVNGTAADKKVVTLQPGASKTLTYTISKYKSGPYSVVLSNATGKFSVKETVQQQTELKYDNDQSKTALWAGNNGGFLIDFTPPTPPFRINTVRICGGVYGTGWEGKTFDLYILDSDMKSVLYDQTYAIAKFPVRGAFPYMAPQWVDFDVPEMNLASKFYIYLYTSTGEHKGIHMGVDDSVFNDHSQLAQGKPPIINPISTENFYPHNIWYADSTKDNWMIRAAGTVLAAH